MGKNASTMASRITGSKPRIVVAVILCAVVVMLAGWFPGDETLRCDETLAAPFTRAAAAFAAS